MRVESSAWMGVTNPRQRRTWVASNANWYKLLNWLLMHDEQLVTFEIDSDRDMMVSLKEVF
jgi:hypothetical protein